MADINRFNSGVFKTPRLLYDAASSVTDAAMQALNLQQDESNYDDIVAASGYSSPLSVLERLGDYYAGKANQYEQRQKKFDKGIIESFTSGDIKSGGKQLWNNIAGSIPSMIGMAVTGGAGNISKLKYAQKTLASALPFISRKNVELSEDESIPKPIRVVNSTLNGLSEVIFDQSFGTQAMLNKVVDVFKNEGRDAAVKVAKDFTKSFASEAIKKIQPVTGTIKGAVEEMSTTLSQNLVDKYTTNPDKDLMDGVWDSGLVGSAMTGGVSVLGTVAYSSSQKKKVGDLMKQREELVDDLDNDNLPDEVKGDLTDKLNKIDGEISIIDDDGEVIVSKLSDDDKKVIAEKGAKINSIEQSLQDESLSETAKETLADRLLKEQDAVDDILTKPKVANDKLIGSLSDNIGENVNYGGIEGKLHMTENGVYVVDSEGYPHLIEGGLSEKTPGELNVVKVDKTEEIIPVGEETEITISKPGEIQFDPETNKLTLRGDEFTYDGVEQDKKGTTTSLRVIDKNGNIKFIRNEDAILEVEIQKELFENKNSGLYNEGDINDAATEIGATEQKPTLDVATENNGGTPEVQQTGSVENIEAPEIKSEVVPETAPQEPTTTKKTVKELEQENKSTLPKVPATNVFVNPVEQPAREDRAKVDALMDEQNPENDKTSELPIESISITDIIPTQKNLTIPNLESVKGAKEKAVVLKKGDKYFIIDGHHRIASQILNGETKIDAHVYSEETVSEEVLVTPKVEAEAESVKEPAATPKEEVAKTISLSASVQDMKVSDISTDEARFQNREALDEQRVKDIAENFDVNKLDPIVVFNEGDKNTVLSGHHRLAAAKQAGIENIPVKVFEGTEQQAKDFAKDSNTLGKQETPSERAKRYRDLRASGEPESQIRDMAQQAHGSDATLMLNLSRLDPNGKSLDAVKQFEKSTDKDTKNKVQAIGDWIGQVKSKHPDLSRRQENEMFDYLLDAYGTKKGGGKVTNRRQFADLADALITRAKGREGFNEETVFNFKNAAGKSGLETEYDASVKEAEQTVAETNKALSEKRKDLLTTGAKKADIDRVLQPFETAVQNAVQDLHNLRKDKGAVQEAVKQQGSIFDIIANDTNLKENDRATREVSEILEQEGGTDEKVTGVGEEIPKPKEPAGEEKQVTEKTKRELATEARKEAQAKLKARNERLGIYDDPKEKAKAYYDYHKALVTEAKEYILEGIDSVEKFAKELGETVTKVVQDAWDEATGGKKLTVEDFEEKPELISDEEANVLGITKQERQRQRTEMGEEQYDYEVKTRSKLEKEADKLLADGFSVPNLIKKLEGGKYTPSAAEMELIRRYYVSLTAKINNSPTPELLAERKELQEILDKTGTRMGQAVQAFDGLMAVEDNLASFLQDEGKYYDLSPEEIQELSEKYNRAKDALEKLQAKNTEALAEAMDKEAQKRLTEARKEAQKRTRASVREDFDVRKKSIADEIRAKLKELRHTPQVTILPYARELIVIAPLVKKYMDVLVEAKIYDLKQIIKDIHAEFKDDIEGLTEGDVRDIIAGKYPNPRKTKNAKLAEIHDLETQARLEAKIEDLEKGIQTTSNPSQRRKKSEKVEELEKQIKEIKRRNPELTAPSKLQGRKTWYTNRVNELRNEVKTGVYDPLEPTVPVLLDKEGLELKDEYATFLKETRERRAKKDYEALNKWEKIGWFGRQLLDIKRLVQTSLDLSIPFRQGVDVMMNIGMPDIRDGKVIWRKGTTSIGVKGYGMMIRSVFDPDGKGLKKATFSDKFYNRMMHDIRSNDAFLESKDDGIVYSEVSSSNSEMRDESHPHENFLYKVQYLGAPLRASERAAASWLNYTRFELYHRGVKFLLRQGKTRENSKQAYEDMAVRVMTDTGRGKIPLLSDKTPSNEGNVIKQLLGHTLYGTRLYSATFRKLNPLYYMGIKNPFNKGYVVDKTVRVEALKDMIGSTTGYILTTLAVAAATGAVVSLDWDDPDFLKFRKGKKLVDHTGGRSVYIRTFLRLVNAVYNHADPTVSHQDAVKYSNFAKKSLESFWRNKLAPNTSYGVNAFMGQNTIGEKFNPYEIIQIYPMYTDDLISAFKESPLDAAIILPIGISGLGYQEYSRDIKKARVSLYISPKDKELSSFLKKHQLNITGDINQEVFDLNAFATVKMTPEQSAKYEKVWSEHVIEGVKAGMPELEKMAVIDKKHEEDKGYHDKVTAEIGQIKAEATKVAKEAVGGVATEMLTIRRDDPDTGEAVTYTLSKEQVTERLDLIKQYRDKNPITSEYIKTIMRGAHKTEAEARIIAEKERQSDANTYAGDAIYNKEDFKKKATMKE